MKSFISHIFALMATALVLTACSSSYSVDADMEQVSNQKLHVIVANPDGVQDAWVQADEGKFHFSGSSEDPALLAIVSNTGQTIATIMVVNGDKLKLKGSPSQPETMRCTGSKANEERYAFMNENAQFYVPGSEASRNAAIAKYVGQYPERMSSTLLLLLDYDRIIEDERAQQLMMSVSPKVRPASLMATYQNLHRMTESPSKNVTAYMLRSLNGGTEAFSPVKAPLSVLYFWTDGQSQRQSSVRALRDLKRQLGDKLQIADVNMEADTTIWRTTIKGDSTTNTAGWQHLWAPGGPQHESIKGLKIQDTPLYIVCDRGGNVIYRGNSVLDATHKAQDKASKLDK